MSWKRGEYPSGYYVYELIDPRTGIPFYVGKGKKNRAYSHLREAISSSKSSSKLLQIREIISSGTTYEVRVVGDHFSESEACDLEVSLIKQYGRRNYDDGGILTNIIIDTRQADFSRVIYRKGEDHHNTGIRRSLDTTEKQRATCLAKSKALGRLNCKCGCGAELRPWQRYISSKSRGGHGFSPVHFDGMNNVERHETIRKLKELISKEPV